MSPVFVLIISVIVIYIVNFFLKKRSLSKKIDHVPGPKGWPILGNALEFGDTTEMLYQLVEYSKQYGKIFKVQIGPEAPMVVITDPKLLEQIMSSSKVLKKSRDYDNFFTWLGTGLLTSTGNKWQKRRKAITPTFHFNILEQFLDVFHSNSDILVKQLEPEIGKESVDLYPFVTLFALDVICESAMGISVDAQTNSNTSEYVSAVKEMGRIVVVRTISAYKRYDFLYKFTEDYKCEQKALKILHDLTESIIKRRRNVVNNNNAEANKKDNDDVGIKKRVAFLDMLLQATIDGEKLADLDIREEVDTFMFEGHDTTASGIAFCLMALAQNPKAQQKAYEEINSIFQDDKNRAPSYRDLQDMKYLELVIKEALRMYPSVPMYGRELTSDLIYEGKLFPSGIMTYFLAFALQRDPTLFENPDTFIPERFLEARTDKDAYSYIPFSAGPRNCIGQKFAMLEMKSTVSKVLRHYELLPVKGFEPVFLFETILKSANGMQVKLKKR